MKYLTILLSLLIFSCNNTSKPSLEENEKVYAEFHNKTQNEKLEAKQNLIELYKQYRKDSLGYIVKKYNQILEIIPQFNKLIEVSPLKKRDEVIINFQTLQYHITTFMSNVTPVKTFHSNDLEKIVTIINKDSLIIPENYSKSDIKSEEKKLESTKKYILSDFLPSKYVLILSDLEYKIPKLENSSFTPGYYKGHAALFNINDTKLIGNFIYEAKSSETIDYKTYFYDGKETEDTNNNQEKAIIEDFINRIHSSLVNELDKRFTIEDNNSLIHPVNKFNMQL